MQKAEIRESGICRNCARSVLRITDSATPTCRTDGVRYIQPEKAESGWSMFRCECGELIESTWTRF